MNVVPGTRKVQLVRTSTAGAGHPLDQRQPATVSNVALQGAPNPVSGVVTLTWTASDADGDPLTFDIPYSRDNGVTFQPIAAGLATTSTQIDTAQLGGSGTARLRVIASDGANTGFGDSATFVMANHPPQPAILNPENNLHIHYGQLVNFSGMALDAQDGTVADAGLVWTDRPGTTPWGGPLISLDNLPVGTNVITLQATNSIGLTASTTVTVIVDDNLDLPGPTLSAGPAQVSWQVPAGIHHPPDGRGQHQQRRQRRPDLDCLRECGLAGVERRGRHDPGGRRSGCPDPDRRSQRVGGG